MGYRLYISAAHSDPTPPIKTIDMRWDVYDDLCAEHEATMICTIFSGYDSEHDSVTETEDEFGGVVIDLDKLPDGTTHLYIRMV